MRGSLTASYWDARDRHFALTIGLQNEMRERQHNCALLASSLRKRVEQALFDGSEHDLTTIIDMTINAAEKDECATTYLSALRAFQHPHAVLHMAPFELQDIYRKATQRMLNGCVKSIYNDLTSQEFDPHSDVHINTLISETAPLRQSGSAFKYDIENAITRGLYVRMDYYHPVVLLDTLEKIFSPNESNTKTINDIKDIALFILPHFKKNGDLSAVSRTSRILVDAGMSETEMARSTLNHFNTQQDLGGIVRTIRTLIDNGVSLDALPVLKPHGPGPA